MEMSANIGSAIGSINPLTILHLVILSFWGGLVITESVLELYPFRQPRLHGPAIEFHYWIDLLLELMLLIAVLLSGILLIFSVELTGVHYLKIVCGLFAVSMNLICVALVIKRYHRKRQGAPDEELWKYSRKIIATAALGIPVAMVAAALGLKLALARMGGG